jgi:hypothetical protein
VPPWEPAERPPTPIEGPRLLTNTSAAPLVSQGTRSEAALQRPTKRPSGPIAEAVEMLLPSAPPVSTDTAQRGDPHATDRHPGGLDRRVPEEDRVRGRDCRVSEGRDARHGGLRLLQGHRGQPARSVGDPLIGGASPAGKASGTVRAAEGAGEDGDGEGSPGGVARTETTEGAEREGWSATAEELVIVQRELATRRPEPWPVPGGELTDRPRWADAARTRPRWSRRELASDSAGIGQCGRHRLDKRPRILRSRPAVSPRHGPTRAP